MFRDRIFVTTTRCSMSTPSRYTRRQTRSLERVRKVGANTLHSIGDIARRQRLSDNDADSVAAQAMLAELCEDNQQLTAYMREAHAVCEEHGDVASTRLLETWIDEAERRVWQLFEVCRSRSV